MGLFDFFKNKKKESSDATNQHSEIVISSTTEGSHGDHYGGLLGFDLLYSEGSELVYKLIQYAEKRSPLMSKGSTNLHDAVLNEVDEITGKIRVRAIYTGERIPSAFPYLKTNYKIPFQTKEVIEWSHIDKLEAEIYGAGRETFGVGFFATDYAINHNKYKSQSNLHIHVSAIGLVMELANFSEMEGEDGLKFSEGFATYMPNQDLPGVSYYNFIGVLEEVREMIVMPDPEVKGYMTKIKLINHEERDFFTIDMFINKSNVRFENVEVGMSVSGCLWLQGEISS